MARVQIPAGAFSERSEENRPEGSEPYQSRAATAGSEHVWFWFKSRPAAHTVSNERESRVCTTLAI